MPDLFELNTEQYEPHRTTKPSGKTPKTSTNHLGKPPKHLSRTHPQLQKHLQITFLSERAPGVQVIPGPRSVSLMETLVSRALWSTRPHAFRHPRHVTGAHRGRPLQIVRPAMPSEATWPHLQREATLSPSSVPSSSSLLKPRCSRPPLSVSLTFLFSLAADAWFQIDVPPYLVLVAWKPSQATFTSSS